MMEYSAFETFRRFYRHLGLIVAVTMVGGLAGLIFHYIQPPVFEAKASLPVSLDPAKTGPLSEFDQTFLLGMARELLISEEVSQQVWSEAQSHEISDDGLRLGRYVFIERRQYVIDIRIRNKSSQTAQALANLWSEKGYQALGQARRHALRAETLSVYLKGLESCAEDLNNGQSYFCSFASFDEVHEELEKVLAELDAELTAAKGITPYLLIQEPQLAVAPQNPAVFGRNLLVFSGSMFGFFAVLAFLKFRK
jgi:hypothetical protein